MSRWLFLAGGLPFLLLGLAHAFATPLRKDARRGLSPADPKLAQAMSESRVLLTGRTDIWLAWVGFNLSHGLGAVFFGASVMLIGRSDASYAGQAAFFGPAAIVVAAAYLVLAVNYWFRTPIVGCALSLALFVGAWLTG